MYLTKGITLLLLALGYVHACQRPDSVRPYYDGNSVGIQVKWKFKRSTEHVDKLYHLNSDSEKKANPCHFTVFDTNGDGFILHGEIQALFDDKEEATRLFIELDRIIADSVITPEEFNLMAPKIIFSCAPDAADGDGLEDPTPGGNAKEKTDA